MDERSIFVAALDQSDPQKRDAYLDSVCAGNATLRARLAALLRSHEQAGEFLKADDATLQATLEMPPPLERPGATIGRYKLLEEIGEGGMGVVFLAEQREPVRRKVALKIIKPGMDTREVIARFEAERQALAMMDHPNIAKVLDGGTTGENPKSKARNPKQIQNTKSESQNGSGDAVSDIAPSDSDLISDFPPRASDFSSPGRPYFVMELVQGLPITDYCDQANLTTRDRLALFVLVCQAVQHAHQKGIIHRDIKPSNVLVALHDGVPVPKVIDFGVAKAIHQPLTENTLFTGQGRMIGTPMYMSPEQAEMTGLDVDTRSDIYSLGVLLYELLTGSTPFDRQRLREAGFDELRRVIREEDPPRPSHRVSTLAAQAAETMSTVTAHRGVDARRLGSLLRGDLDWIVMKALQKDRSLRYESASALAADVERYLNDEAVEACPPSAAYRFTKFARRNRVALVTTALVALALIAGTAVSVWQATRATRAEQQIAATLQTAEKRLGFARQAVDDMYTQVAEKWLAQQADMTPVQREFLEKALAFYEQLASETGVDPAVQFEAAKAQQRVGEIQRKLGHHKEAEAALRRAVTLLDQLARESKDPAKYNQALARAHDRLGRLLLFAGQPVDAEHEHRLAVAIHRDLVDHSPADAQYQRDLANSNEGLGLVLYRVGQWLDANAAYSQSAALLQSLLSRTPGDRDLKFALVKSQAQIALTLDDVHPFHVDPLLQSVVTSAKALVAADPKNPEYLEVLSVAHRTLGRRVYTLRPAASHFWIEAEAELRQALTIDEGLVRKYPQVPSYRANLATTLDALGYVLEVTGTPAAVDQIQHRSREIGQKLAAEYPNLLDYQSALGVMAGSRATTLMNRGKWEEARKLLEQAITHQKAALGGNTRRVPYCQFLDDHRFHLIVVQIALGNHAAAARTAAEGAEYEYQSRLDCHAGNTMKSCETLVTNWAIRQEPDQPYPHRREAELAAHILLIKAIVNCTVLRSRDDPNQFHVVYFLTTAPEPLRDPALALKLARRAVELKPGDGLCMQALGWALYRAGDYRGSIETLRKPPNGGASFIQAMAHSQLGEKTEAKTHFAEASEWLKGYEQRCEEALKKRTITFPFPVQLKRLQAEAAALLGVTPSPAKPAAAEALPKTAPAALAGPSSKPAGKEKEKPQKP